MSQRYTPSQLALLIPNADTDGLYPAIADPALSGLEMNTLLLVADFSALAATLTLQPWVNVRSKDSADATIDNWLPLAQVTIVSEAVTANPPALPTANPYRAPALEVALPNCHEVRVEQISLSAGTVNLWGATANRAPR